MLISFVCVFIASLLPIIWVGIAKVSAGFRLKNNRNPREFMAAASGKALRAKWAEQNAWESFPSFAAAVLIAVYCEIDPLSLSLISILFIIVRVFHGVFYIMDKPKHRSTVWFIGMGCNASLYLLSIFKFQP